VCSSNLITLDLDLEATSVHFSKTSPATRDTNEKIDARSKLSKRILREERNEVDQKR
jgi:hypothetical protein